MSSEFDFTAGDRALIALHLAKMAKRSLAGDSVYLGDLERKIARIEDRARRRAEAGRK